MRAVVYTADGDVVGQDRPEPVPGSGEALLRPGLVGICGTDLHPATFDFDPDVVMGHEFCATVVGLGPDVAGWEAGDRVVVNPNGILCGSCDACRSGRLNLCDPARRASVGIHRDGGLADLVALPVRALHRLPPDMGDEVAAWVEPLAANVRAVSAAGPILGRRTLVIGGGPMGLLTLQLVRNAGASFVGVVEPVQYRRTVAERLGADAAFASAEAAATALVRPPELVFECSGSPSALPAALHLVAPGGSVIAVGIGPAVPGILPMEFVGKEITMRGSSLYVGEFPLAIEMLAGGQVNVQSLTSGIEPLERYAEAFDQMRRPEAAVKFLLRP